MLPETLVTLIWTFEKSWFCPSTDVPSASSTARTKVTVAARNAFLFIGPPARGALYHPGTPTRAAQVLYLTRHRSGVRYLQATDRLIPRNSQTAFGTVLVELLFEFMARQAPENRNEKSIAGQFCDRNRHHDFATSWFQTLCLSRCRGHLPQPRCRSHP